MSQVKRQLNERKLIGPLTSAQTTCSPADEWSVGSWCVVCEDAIFSKGKKSFAFCFLPDVDFD